MLKISTEFELQKIENFNLKKVIFKIMTIFV